MEISDYEIMESIACIRRKIGESYPYSAGSAIINCPGFSRKALEKIIKHFIKRNAHIVVNYEKKQVVITGYMSEF